VEYFFFSIFFISVSVSKRLLLIFFDKFVYSLNCISFLFFVLLSVVDACSVYVVNSFSSCSSFSLDFLSTVRMTIIKKDGVFGDGHLLELVLSFNTRDTTEIRHGYRTYTTEHSLSDLTVYAP
jgi:hypothetical protein